MKVDNQLTPGALLPLLTRFWEISARKIALLDKEYDHSAGAPVYTVKGRYTSRSWTDWTRGFVFGSAILQFDAAGDRPVLNSARDAVTARMRDYLTHTGVHDHGFNVISTFGNLRRLMAEGKIEAGEGERLYVETALRCSGAVQAARWTALPSTGGYISSFNGPHSLFADTVRTLRSLAVAHGLGHTLYGENDQRISLFHRLVQHAETTARYAVYYGEGRDTWDVRGRVAHESIFNIRDGNYRCPNSQQGYSGFTTWTRGLAWVLAGYPELLEYLDTVPDSDYPEGKTPEYTKAFMLKAACASADFFIANTATDGIPYWDTGAPGLVHMGDFLNRPSDPFNGFEPVDSSAAAISAQGLVRLGRYLQAHPETGSDAAPSGAHYIRAGLTSLKTMLESPYLSTGEKHQGLLLHSIYHRPNGWDYVPEGSAIPNGEACMWGDYHIRELALYVQRIAAGERDLRFFTGLGR
jgi:hypothetical protein